MEDNELKLYYYNRFHELKKFAKENFNGEYKSFDSLIEIEFSKKEISRKKLSDLEYNLYRAVIVDYADYLRKQTTKHKNNYQSFEPFKTKLDDLEKKSDNATLIQLVKLKNILINLNREIQGVINVNQYQAKQFRNGIIIGSILGAVVAYFLSKIFDYVIGLIPI